MSAYPQSELDPAQSLERLEHDESRLWHAALLMLGFVALAMAAATWETLRSLPQRLEAVPIGAVVLIALFGIYAFNKKRRITELRGTLRMFRAGNAMPPGTGQVDPLTKVIANSQRGYRELIDSFDDLMFSLGGDGRLRAVNMAFARLLGRPFSQVVGHRLDEFFEEPGAVEVRKHLAQLMERSYWSGPLRVRLREGGAVKHLDCTLHASTQDGQIVSISGLARDVTDQRQREIRFTELFETLQEGVYFTTLDGTILDVNQAFAHMLGYDNREELLARNAADLYCDREERRQEMLELERAGAFRGREIRLRRKDDNVIVCQDSARAVWDAGRRQLRCQGTVVDITERRQVESRLHEEQEFRRRLVDSFPDLIIAVDQTGRFTFVSPRLKDMLGYEPQQLIGRNVSGEVSRACAPEFEKLCLSLMSGDKLFGTAEYPAQHADGTWHTMRAAASPLFDAEGKLSGVVASVRDITEAKQLEQQLIHSEKMAAIGRMIEGFAHELNNPLTAIMGAADLLAEQVKNESSRKNFQLLQNQARRAAEIVQNLLFFARPPQPGSTRINLADLVQRSLQLHEHSLRMNSIAVDFLADANVPPLVGDPNQLMQVFLSLIINAEQAIRQVRQQGTLRARIQNQGKSVAVIWQDDGPGFAPEALPHVFDPLFTAKRPGRGTGLGLSIAMAILKKYGGDITAANAPGGGALVTVSLPIAEAAAKSTTQTKRATAN